MSNFDFFPFIVEKKVGNVYSRVYLADIPATSDGVVEYDVSDYAILNGALVQKKSGAFKNVNKILPMPNGGTEAIKAKGTYSIIPSITLAGGFLLNDESFLSAVDVKTHSFCCGEYPQSIASNKWELEEMYQKLNAGQEIEGFSKTGKIYCGYSLSGRGQGFEQNAEYIFNNQKYVRVSIPNEVGYENGFTGLDGKKAEWCRVEPVEWKIKNWPEFSSKKGENIEIVASKALIAGLPFSKTVHPKAELWENSIPRGYLNGVNLLDVTTKSSAQMHVPNGWNFSSQGFLDEIRVENFQDIKTRIEKRKELKSVAYDAKKLTSDQQLATCINSGVSVFLHGSSGVGKSARVKQIDPTATRITLRPQMNPEEIDGTLNRETGGYIPPLWYTDLCKKCKEEPDRKHILFIDELTNVKPTVQSLVYSIVLDRAGKDGLWPLPENAVVVAAGNESKDNLAAYPLTNALFRRFTHIYYNIDKSSFLDWASGVSGFDSFKTQDLTKNIPQNIHPFIIEFIKVRGAKVLYQDLDEENPRIVTDPRKWEIASKLLYATHNLNAIEPAVGTSVTAEFVDFVKGEMHNTSGFLLSADNVGALDDFEEYSQHLKGSPDLYKNANRSSAQTKMKKSNAYGFSFDNLDSDQLLQGYINAGVSVFLHGSSGVGKSARVKQIDPTATRITLRPQMNPEEIDGTLNRETGGYIPPLWYTDLCKKCKEEPDRKHILFIDELTNVKPTVQSLVYSIVLDRAGKDGLWPLPKNAVVVAAGNESEGNLVAEPMTNALFRRFSHIYYEIDPTEWLKWAVKFDKAPIVMPETKEEIKARVHPAIFAYIKARPQSVLNQDLDEEDPKIVTDPRKWQIASEVLYATKNPNALLPAIGRELTADFVDFVSSATLTVEDILKGKAQASDFADADISTKLSNISGIVDVDEKDLPAVRQFIEKAMGREILATYDGMWIKNDTNRALILDEVKQFGTAKKIEKKKNPFTVVDEDESEPLGNAGKNKQKDEKNSIKTNTQKSSEKPQTQQDKMNTQEIADKPQDKQDKTDNQNNESENNSMQNTEKTKRRGIFGLGRRF